MRLPLASADTQLEGKLVVVTGASSGIGKATAKRIARDGGHVALLARTESALESVADSIRENGGTASVVPVDLADREAVGAAAETIQADIGDPDILVNSAGVGSRVAAWEADPGTVEYDTAVTAFGAYNPARAFLPAMLDRNNGHTVVIESPTAHTPIPGATPYQVARCALRGLSESLWMDLYSTEIGVTGVVPGTVNTEYFDRNDDVEERFPGTAEGLRTLEPEEVAETVVSGIRNDKRRVYVPRKLRWTIVAGRLAPNKLDARTAQSSRQPTLEES